MQDELDRRIDSALAMYSSAEPLAGIEQRVLERVRLAGARRRRWRWALVLAAPALAAALLVILAPKPKPAPTPVAVMPAPAPQIHLPAPEVRVRAPRRVAGSRRPARAPKPPKRDVFPTISPLTGEERLLVQLAQASPQLLLAQPVAEIEIKPIQIAPLQIDGAQ